MQFMKRFENVAAFILAGGASSRMGRDKGLLEFGGVPLIFRTAHLLMPVVASVTVVGSPDRYAVLGLHAIADEVVGEEGTSQGPLAGIASALRTTSTPWNLILACDLPYLTIDWLNWLLSRAMDSRAQIVVPRTSQGLEPLAAVYHRECIETIDAAIARGVRRVADVVAELRSETVHASEWRGFDPEGLVLRNMNALEDYEAAKKWWEARPSDERDRPMPERAY
jgi:molybdopterin-guanine dinucleotide biosynthesis protein A